KELLGDRHPSVATSLNNLAGLYVTQGKFTKAESFRLQCLEIELETLGQDHPQVQQSLNNFVGLLQAAMEAEALDKLSDHPITQGLLKQLRNIDETSA
ncbi:tetratricopeptide repeat protein, partial [[Limnothrix rosea] IAM M-220]|uniref:tetratricopeptide repeat protein n=1 Tax=[Limnothrix rosea] IAM M-220 TaxID=454133 RepID=UPI000960145A